MKFEIVCGNEYASEFEADIRRILLSYPHSLDISIDLCGKKFIIESFGGMFEDMHGKLLRIAVSYMLYSEKLKFYSKSLFQILPYMKQFILTRILIFAEFEHEVKELCLRVKNSSIVICDGIKNFMLNKYKNEWSRMSEIVNIVCSEFNDEIKYIEFIKGMSRAIVSKYSILYLFCGQKKLLLSDKLAKINCIHLNIEKLNNEDIIISALIENYPTNVAIFEKYVGGGLDEALSILFDTRKSLKLN